MELSKRGFLVLLAIIGFAIKANAQVKVFGKNQLENIQNGHTHVIVNRLDFPESNEFISVFKKYWTLTQGIDFIETSNLQDNLFMGDSYFIIETETFDYAYKMNGAFFSRNGGNIFLKLWMPTEKTFKDKKFDIKHVKTIANVLLTANYETVTNPFTYNFDGEGHIYNWNTGILKNYLQILERQIKSDNPAHLSNHEHLGDLKTQPLYCPEDDFFRGGSTKDYKKVDIKDVFGDYKYSYEAIPDKELGEKILNGKDFYYLLFIINEGEKTIAVINSASGEIVYSMLIHGSLSSHLDSRDLKELYNSINKN